MFRSFRQEACAIKGLRKAIHAKGWPEYFTNNWHEDLEGCTEWPAQKLKDVGWEFHAVAEGRNAIIIKE
eukprot:5239436-Heterocapsa_arctica.AAC.1